MSADLIKAIEDNPKAVTTAIENQLKQPKQGQLFNTLEEDKNDEPRRPGRPKGSGNKRDVDLIAQITNDVGCLLTKAAELAKMAAEQALKTRDPKDISVANSCMNTVLPYVAQKRPVAIDATVNTNVNHGATIIIQSASNPEQSIELTSSEFFEVDL